MATKKTAYEAPTPASDKKKALQTALAQLEKSYGTAAELTRLYNNAKANYEKQHKQSLEELSKDYEQKRNDAAAQKLIDEKKYEES